MFAAEIAFRSWVAEAGYEWKRYRDLPLPKGRGFGGWRPDSFDKYPGEVLMEVPCGARRYRSIEPFQDPTLYREFAAIRWGDRAAAVAFANKYGPLDANLMMGTSACDPLPPGVRIRHRQQMPCGRLRI